MGMRFVEEVLQENTLDYNMEGSSWNILLLKLGRRFDCALDKIYENLHAFQAFNLSQKQVF